MREALLFGRICFSLIFVIAGFGHFADATISYAASQGVPYASLLVPLSGLLAIFGGLSIAFGYRAKIGAWALVAFLVPVTLKMHAFWMVTDPVAAQLQQAMFLKNIAMLGGALTFAYFGTGPYSVDSRVTVDERTPIGTTTSVAGTVIPTSLRREVETELAVKKAAESNDASHLTGMW